MKATIQTLTIFAFLLFALTACSTIMQSATSGLADNLNAAIMNQDDPETVRDGAPAYLLMLDSFVEGSPEDAAMLSAAAELYAAYGVIFVTDAQRADRLTHRARAYGQRALCASNHAACNLQKLSFKAFKNVLDKLSKKDVASLFTYGLTSIAYIKVHSNDWNAMAKLPHAEATFLRVLSLDDQYQPAQVEHYLAVLNTIRPPAMGGHFDTGKAHFERAISLSGGKDLSISVDYARYYARTLYDRKLHDRLLKDVLSADPVQQGYTLFNVLAQKEAHELLESADDYF